MQSTRRASTGSGRSGRRSRGSAPRLAWVLALVFAFIQLVIPAYACAVAGAPAHHSATSIVGDATDGDVACSEHAFEGSLLCFKHCHPDAQSTATPMLAMAAIAPGPSEPIALVASVVARIQPRANTPGLAPPTSISFCRKLL